MEIELMHVKFDEVLVRIQNGSSLNRQNISKVEPVAPAMTARRAGVFLLAKIMPLPSICSN